MSKNSVQRREQTRERLTMHVVLKEAQERFKHELMSEEERCELHSRIVRLKKRLAATLPR